MNIAPCNLNDRTFDSESLSLNECVALVLRSHVAAKQIISRIGRELPEAEQECALFQSLERNPLSFFENISSVDKKKQMSLIAAFELGRRYHKFRGHIDFKQNIAHIPAMQAHSLAISRISQSFKSDIKEWIGFVPIHTNYQIGEFCLIERGARTFIHFEASELFARLLSLRPKGYFLFHNHPSKILTPSTQDLELTTRLKVISQDLNVPLIDHGIVSFNNTRWIVV